MADLDDPDKSEWRAAARRLGLPDAALAAAVGARCHPDPAAGDRRGAGRRPRAPSPPRRGRVGAADDHRPRLAEQQHRFVGPTLRGELAWCQMFTEPGAGSDLASLTTRATKVDGGWSLTGQKVWTTMAQEGRLGDLPGPHRPRRAQARGHRLLPARHGDAGHRHPSAARADRHGDVQRGVPRPRCSYPTTAWSARPRGVGLRPHDAGQRAGVDGVGLVVRSRPRRPVRRWPHRTTRSPDSTTHSSPTASAVSSPTPMPSPCSACAPRCGRSAGAARSRGSVRKLAGVTHEQAVQEVGLGAARARRPPSPRVPERPGRRASSVIGRSRSPAAPARSSATSSPNGCWACPRTPDPRPPPKPLEPVP